MKVEKYSLYEYVIRTHKIAGISAFDYEILLENNYLNQPMSINSGEYYDSEGEAIFKAKERIDLLENGE